MSQAKMLKTKIENNLNSLEIDSLQLDIDVKELISYLKINNEEMEEYLPLLHQVAETFMKQQIKELQNNQVFIAAYNKSMLLPIGNE
jgi:hypothetical protein